jgi:hypothetical protein
MAARRRVQSRPFTTESLLFPLHPHLALPPSPAPQERELALRKREGGLVKSFNFQAQNRDNSLYIALIRFMVGLASPGVRFNSR